jgi:hypothetical protein
MQASLARHIDELDAKGRARQELIEGKDRERRAK